MNLFSPRSFSPRAIAAAAGALALVSAASAQITQVAPATLTGTGLITFDDVAGGAHPGVSHDAIFESNGADFAERFVGQSVVAIGDNDQLTGAPTGPLSLQLGAVGQNLSVFFYTTSQVLTGLGNVGFPDASATGEGAFAVLFDYDQSEFGFELVGGNGGNATVDFFRRDGSLIQSILLSGLSDQNYAFRRDGGLHDIAGISIWNNDLGGIGFDNLRHDVPGVIGPGNAVPEPSTYGVIGAATLLGLLALRRRKA